MSRKPKIPSDKVGLPVDQAYEAACRLIPEIDEWWFSVHTCLVSMVPIERKDDLLKSMSFSRSDMPLGEQCTLRDLNGEMCERPADFIVVSVFIIPGTGTIAGRRLRAHCSQCLYLGMSRAITHMTSPEFYDASDDLKDGEEKGDGMYLIAERSDFLQKQLPRVVKMLKDKDPEVLNRLNELIRSGDMENVGE